MPIVGEVLIDAMGWIIVAGTSKLIFILLMFTVGRPYLGRQVRAAVAVDFVNVLLYAGYLTAAPAV